MDPNTSAIHILRSWHRPTRALLACATLLAGCSGEPSLPHSLLLVTVDTLRADRVGAFGSRYGLTPNIDTLADESVAFEFAYAAAPFTLPSMAAMMTGRNPEALGVFRNESALPDTIPTLAAALQGRGWRTHAVVSNFILRRSSGIGNGFHVYDDEFPQVEAVRRWPERVAGDTTDAALQSLDTCTDSTASCFLWVHYQDPHGPYTPPGDLHAREIELEQDAPDADRILPLSADHTGLGGIPDYQVLQERRDVGFYRAGYHAEVRYLDAEIGRLLRGVSSRGLTDETLIVLASDHGEGMGEDDYWFAHGEYLSDAQVRVPLLFRLPGREPERRNDVASLLDVVPTVLAALRLPPLAAPGRGRDLLAPDAREGSSRVYLATLGGSRRARFGLIDGGFKLVIVERDGIWDGQLTRLGDDGKDMAAAAPQITGRMRQRLLQIRTRMLRQRETRQDLSEQDREYLRALGYVEESGGS